MPQHLKLNTLAETRRYSRQIMLPEIDLQGQERLLNSRVLIVGLGGLGCAAAPYLATAGVGCLTLIDGDRIELSNLQRQPLYDETNIGACKAEIAQVRLAQINSAITVQSFPLFADETLLAQQVPAHDLVLDCTDNLHTRLLINQACVTHKIPLVSAAAIRFDGQLICFDNQGSGPCYSCFSQTMGQEQLSCSESGIVPAVVGLIGVAQALLAFNILTGLQVPWHQLQLFDGQRFIWNSFKLSPLAQCHCAHHNAD